MKGLVEIIFNFLQTSHHHAQLIYFIFLVLAYLDSIAFLGLFIPGTWIVISTGIFVANTSLNIFFCMMFLTIGAFLSDTTSFFLGKFFNQKLHFLFVKYPSGIEKGKKFFKKYGGISVLLGRFIGPLRPIIPFIWGMFNLPSYKFCLIDVISSIISISVLFGIGFLMGKSIFEIKNVDPWILFLLLLVFITVFILCKIIWKFLIKLEYLGLKFLNKIEKFIYSLKPYQKTFLLPFIERSYKSCFFILMLLFLFFTALGLMVIISNQRQIDTKLLPVLMFIAWHFKSIWVLFSFINQNYTITVLIFSFIILSYFLISKKCTVYWIFCVILIFLESILFSYLLYGTYIVTVFKSSLIVFYLSSLSFLLLFRKNIDIFILILAVVLIFFIPLLNLFSYDFSTIEGLIIGSIIGEFNFILFSLLFLQNDFVFSDHYFIVNTLILAFVCCFIYLNSMEFKDRINIFQTKIIRFREKIVSDKKFLLKNQIICLKICGTESDIKKKLLNSNWEQYRFYDILFKPISKEKLIFFFDDIRSFFSYSWYGTFPDLSFIKQHKKERFILKLWKKKKIFISFAWYNLKDFKRAKMKLIKELKEKGLLCEQN